MRVIKFRVWIPKAGGMLDSADAAKCDNYVSFAGVPVWVDTLDGPVTEHPEYQLSQFTGLLDANGREVYEGDIVRSDDGSYVVKYSDHWAGFEPFLTWQSEDRFHRNLRSSIVVGNRWENPQLAEACEG